MTMENCHPKFLLSGILLFIGAFTLQCGSDSTTIPEISAWSFVDGNGKSGINKDPAGQAYQPEPVIFDSKFYVTWYEYDGFNNTRVHVAVFNGDAASPAWIFVSGANGLNKDSMKVAEFPQLAVMNSKLYATWSEDNGTATQIRIAVYNGDDSSPTWTFVDGNGTNGINKDSGKDGRVPSLIAFNGQLYATWSEKGLSFVEQVRVAVYNGNDSSPAWAFVDGNGSNGINKNSFASAPFSKLV